MGVVTEPLSLGAGFEAAPDVPALDVPALDGAVPLAGVWSAGVPKEGGGVAVVVAGGVEPAGTVVPVELAAAGSVEVPPAAGSVVVPPAGVPVAEPVVEPLAAVPVVGLVAAVVPLPLTVPVLVLVLDVLGFPVPCP